MAFEPINLIALELDRPNLFRHLPKFESLYYEGQITENVQHFRALREGLDWTLLTVTIIRKDEDFLWTSAKDLLDRAVKQAASHMRGIHTFDLLTFDFRQEIKTFNYNELAQVLINSSLRIKPGEQVLIKYSSCYGMLKKMIEEPWGKVAFKTAVKAFNDKPNFLLTLAKKMLKPAISAPGPLIALINDLSSTPLYNSQDEKQKLLLQKLIAEQAQQAIEFPPKVYMQDVNGWREIL